jgi:murein DD-endopeptidase MepM/ murein hydrolase activator NlpD
MGVVIASATARTRQGPSVGYAEGPLINRNDRVPILEVQPGEGGDPYRWMRITANGQSVWTRETNLSIEGDATMVGLPVDLYTRPMADCWWVRGFEGGHKGWDLGAKIGEPIMSGQFGGVVTMTLVCTKCTLDKPNTPAWGYEIGDQRIFSDPGWGYGYGNWVIVRYLHDALPQSTRDFLASKALAGAHLFVTYAHLHTIEVKQGQKLEGGAPVGSCGNTGNSEATHLHLEVRAWKDPNETSWARMSGNVFDPIVLFGR